MESGELGLYAKILEPVIDLLQKVFGPAASEIGEAFGDRVRQYRFNNSLRVLEQTKAKLEAAGIEPETVPLRTLLPLLEGASLEDNDELSEKWANLFANAATPEKSKKVLPVFPHILGSLRPQDARLLDLMYRHEQMGGTVSAADGAEIDRGWTLKTEVLEQLAFSEEEFNLSFANLRGLGLTEIGGRRFGTSKHEFVDKREIGLTVLGSQLLECCN